MIDMPVYKRAQAVLRRAELIKQNKALISKKSDQTLLGSIIRAKLTTVSLWLYWAKI